MAHASDASAREVSAPTNWAGNHRYRARSWHQPGSLEELRELAARLPRWRVIGSRHSFTDLADADALISLDALPPRLEIDATGRSVTVGAATRYGDLARALHEDGLALANLASLPHISIAGAVSTATHGSGARNGNLATAVAGLELVRSDGALARARRGEPDFAGMVVALGGLGAITALTLDVEPAYEVAQHVYEGLDWASFVAHLDEIATAAYSVSAFTRWREGIDQVWCKHRPDRDGTAPPPAELFGAPAATVERHPIIGLDPVHCTEQLGVRGAWMDRLPHFRMGFTPSSGEEIQSEYHLPRERAAEALGALAPLSGRLAPLTQVCELRWVAGDELWLSPQHGRDSFAIHFTWVADQAAVERLLVDVEAALLPLGARPHWGKLFLARGPALQAAYPRLGDFLALRDRLDPRRGLWNAWLERTLGDGAGG